MARPVPRSQRSDEIKDVRPQVRRGAIRRRHTDRHGLCGLRVGAVDFARGTVHITETLNVVHRYGDAKRTLVEGPTKSTAGDRVLPMPTWLRDDLAAMLAARDETERAHRAPLFRAVKGAGRLEVPMLRDHVIRPALRAARLPESFRTYDPVSYTHLTLPTILRV